MEVYDCFIFSSELDILELRLEYLYNTVDHFVLVESARTLSNQPKPLYYQENKVRFAKFQDKIIHLVAPTNALGAWDYEYFQRNWIKEGLKHCRPDALIFIADVDEIVNIKYVLSRTSPGIATFIEIPMYYYFLNLKVGSPLFFNMVMPYAQIKDMDIGDRQHYAKTIHQTLPNTEGKNGWHFSYLYGRDTTQYVNKVRSFSHQEFNTAYYLNENRIKTCILLGVDLFERAIPLTVDDSVMLNFGASIPQIDLTPYIYTETPISKMPMINLWWAFRMKVINRIKNAFINRILK